MKGWQPALPGTGTLFLKDPFHLLRYPVISTRPGLALIIFQTSVHITARRPRSYWSMQRAGYLSSPHRMIGSGTSSLTMGGSISFWKKIFPTFNGKLLTG